jgi:formate-dependent nitrite reductase membrane component NrfD
MADHFARAPEWTWYILGYFFLAGMSGGSYVIACLLRLFGRPGDEAAARLAVYIAFPTFLLCPVLLTLDLGQPTRFWHMLVDTSPGTMSPVFKYWSPMSVGAWGLVIFGAFVTVSFVDALARDGRLPGFRWLSALLSSFLGTLWHGIGALLGLFIAGYTGVLLAVSNQPVWSDSWVLGGLFLASGLSGAAALLAWLVHHRADAQESAVVVARFERFFPLLELLLILGFVGLLIQPGTLSRAFEPPWLWLWLVAFVGLLPGLTGIVRTRASTSSDGAVVVRSRGVALAAIIVMVGVLALRAAIIFSAQ